MKKIIYTAMIAIVAIGGAVVSSNAQTAPFHLGSITGTPFNCVGGGADCLDRINGQTVVDSNGQVVQNPETFFANKLFQQL
jgi:uncharacterized protein (DUF697 family)